MFLYFLVALASLAVLPADAFSPRLMRSTWLRMDRTLLSSISMSSDSHFDYLVIGGGSGGMASARRAAGYGAKVGIVEKAAMGGTCVNVGCVPKKVMFNAATVSELIHESKQFGFSIKEDAVKFDWRTIKDARDKYVKRLNGIYERNLANSNIRLIEGAASFSGPKELTVGEAKYTADHILIAVGGKPWMPKLPGVEHCITSNGFFALEYLPKSTAVVGGGYIGVELAGVLNGLGSDVKLFTRGERPLAGFDDLIVDTLLSEMKKQGLQYINNQSPAEIIQNMEDIDADSGKPTLSIKMASGEIFGPFSEVLMATGRVPTTDVLNLEAADVEIADKKGHIKVDEYQSTSAKGVYALGDVIGRAELTPVAIAAGRRLADRLFGGMKDAKISYDDICTVVFSHPTIGTVGLTEARAKEKHGEEKIKVYTSTFTNLWYGTYDMEPADKPKTAMKIVTLLPSEKVLGIHMIGMGCDEALQGFGVALKMGATKADLDSCIAIHPTAAEELVTLAPWGMSPPNA